MAQKENLTYSARIDICLMIFLYKFCIAWIKHKIFIFIHLIFIDISSDQLPPITTINSLIRNLPEIVNKKMWN